MLHQQTCIISITSENVIVILSSFLNLTKSSPNRNCSGSWVARPHLWHGRSVVLFPVWSYLRLTNLQFSSCLVLHGTLHWENGTKTGWPGVSLLDWTSYKRQIIPYESCWIIWITLIHLNILSLRWNPLFISDNFNFFPQSKLRNTIGK